MERRDFLKRGTAAAAGIAASDTLLRARFMRGATHERQVPHRVCGKTDSNLSIIGLGGMAMAGVSQPVANNLVAESAECGINYIDISPTYDDAQQRLGPALKPYRNRFFLAGKTLERGRAGAARELDESLRQMRTDHLDLYQLHALEKIEDVHRALAPGGAIEAFQQARKTGKVRFLGFSAHSEEAALLATDQFDFDTILFPVNFVMYSQAHFGPRVVQRAREKQMGVMAIKAMAKTNWPTAVKKHHPYPKCWYKPSALPHEAYLALRWTLSQPVTSAIPPGDFEYFRLAMYAAQNYSPLSEREAHQLMAGASGVKPVFPRKAA